MAETITALSRGKEGVDFRELRQLTKDLNGWNPDKPLKKALRKAGRVVAEDAKAIAAEHSKSIPPSIKVRLSKTRISIVAGGEGVPMAGLLELGNKGRGKSQAAAKRGTFRHPVFGDREIWVNQEMHPYLVPATQRNVKTVERLVGEAVAEAFRKSGWKT